MGEGPLISSAIDLASDQVDQAAAVLRRRLRSIVVPNAGSKPVAIGSGVLLRVGARHICVTAAHVLDKVRNSGGGVFLPQGKILQLKGPFFSTPVPEGGHRRDDQYDLGFAELTQEQVSALSSDHFLVPTDLAQNEAAAPRWMYMMLGYPGSRTKLKRKPSGTEYFNENLSRFFGFEADGAEFQRHGISRDTHVLINVDRRPNTRQKRQPDGPELPGMSGGGIWRMPHFADRIAEDQRPKLVAIFIADADANGALLLGTRVPIIVEILRAALPDVHIHLPKSEALNVTVRLDERDGTAGPEILAVDPAVFEVESESDTESEQ
jgi:hypothetical protein